MVAANFNGLFAPAGVRKPIIDLIAQATHALLQDEEFQKPLINSGFEPVLDSGPDAVERTVTSELARWTPIMKTAGFKME
jgi:tripartite-type tricarboxylate transporter receptor subunit TctC